MELRTPVHLPQRVTAVRKNRYVFVALSALPCRSRGRDGGRGKSRSPSRRDKDKEREKDKDKDR